MDVGKDVNGPELAGVVNGLVERLTGFRPATSDPFTAGYALSEALQGRRILLVVDDVWTAAQVEPFLQGGPGTVRLITTRNSGILPEGTERSVTVSALTESEGTSPAHARPAGCPYRDGAGACQGDWRVATAPSLGQRSSAQARRPGRDRDVGPGLGSAKT